MNRKLRTIALSFAAAASLAGGVALAQQPAPQQPAPRPQPGQPLPGQPRPGQPRPVQLPGGHPPMPGMQPGGPGGRQQPIIGPDGRPLQRPGSPGNRPGGPPGFNPRPRPVAHEPEPAHHANAEHGCPGHGPNEPPPEPNFWHGILMVNNEAAQKDGFLNKLLFRYENPLDPCDPKNEPPPFLASVINFGVFAFLLYRFGRKPLAEALVKRKQTIMADIDTATKLKESAEERLEEYEEKLENIEGKLEEVRAEYAAQAEIEKEHILAEAEERRVRMRRDAEFRVEQELKAMRAELLREAVVTAVSGAETLIQKQIRSGDQDKMANDYLKSVGPSLNGVQS